VCAIHKSSCFSRCLRVPIAMRRFYEQTLWIPQNFPPTNPDLHHGLLRTPTDAIPDLSENQVIVYTDWAGRSPQEVEDQITYPLTVNLQGLAGVRDVRSSSALGFSMINIIFQDKVDPYFARTRVLERLNLASGFLPEGVVPVLGPDATGVGQVFWVQ
jgi:Cu(I)/Ag(I) efflux system membrane protein CusA/SilA